MVGALRQKSGGRILSNFIARRREEASKEISRESSDSDANLQRPFSAIEPFQFVSVLTSCTAHIICEVAQYDAVLW